MYDFGTDEYVVDIDSRYPDFSDVNFGEDIYQIKPQNIQPNLQQNLQPNYQQPSTHCYCKECLVQRKDINRLSVQPALLLKTESIIENTSQIPKEYQEMLVFLFIIIIFICFASLVSIRILQNHIDVLKKIIDKQTK